MYRARTQVGYTKEWERYFDGSGVTAAILDTGIFRHPDFGGRIIAFQDFVEGRKSPYDDAGHGTHVAGCLAGDGRLGAGRYKGMAAGCSLVVGKILNSSGDGQVERMIEGIEWILEVRQKYHIGVLNLSIGAGKIRDGQKERLLLKRIEEAWDQGILVVAAAGNKGPGPMTVSAIGSLEKVITVGCNEGGYFGSRKDLCEAYSGRGADTSVVSKPDLVAPGTDIIACSSAYRSGIWGWQHAYEKRSGTSMATPIVAGAAVLARQRYPHFCNEQIKGLMLRTATDLREPRAKQGWGMVHVGRILR